jgi:hypothetical protein
MLQPVIDVDQRLPKWSRPRLALISRRAAELGERHDHHVLHQAAVGQVVDQRGHHVVEFGDQFLVRLEVLAVAVPPGTGDADERHAGFNQAAGDQALFAKLRRAVLGANCAGSG